MSPFQSFMSDSNEFRRFFEKVKTIHSQSYQSSA
jgi:hypothetical protein